MNTRQNGRYYRKRFTGYGVGLALCLALLALMHGGMGSFRGHANMLNLLPALGIIVFRFAAAYMALALVWTLVVWLRAGRPKSPF